MARGLLFLYGSVGSASAPTVAPASGPALAPAPIFEDSLFPSSNNKANQRLTVLALAIASALAIVFLLLIYYVVLLRHRSSLRRRRRRRLIRSLTGTNLPDGDGDDVGNHHAWHIRTVGLDSEAIESIPVVMFGENKGGVDDCDCAVCLSEFDQGELLRLLPKCGHAFHVQCIDTWLRSHVNCPLCRSPVLPAPVAPALDDDAGSSPESSEAGEADAGSAAAEANRDVEEGTYQIRHGPTNLSLVKVPAGENDSTSGGGESSSHGSSSADVPDSGINDMDFASEGRQRPDEGHQTSPYTVSYLRANAPVQRSISMDSSLSATSLPPMELGGSSDSKELVLAKQLPVFSEEKQESDPKGVSDCKSPVEMERSLSSSGGNFLLSRLGRGRSSSILPI